MEIRKLREEERRKEGGKGMEAWTIIRKKAIRWMQWSKMCISLSYIYYKCLKTVLKYILWVIVVVYFPPLSFTLKLCPSCWKDFRIQNCYVWWCSWVLSLRAPEQHLHPWCQGRLPPPLFFLARSQCYVNPRLCAVSQKLPPVCSRGRTRPSRAHWDSRCLQYSSVSGGGQSAQGPLLMPHDSPAFELWADAVLCVASLNTPTN